MKRLRRKLLNDFIDTLNEREQKYIFEKIKKEIEQKEIGKLDFTINGKRYIA